MSENQGEPEFAFYQQELDSAFHTRQDAFPAGTTEHSELLSFITKLYKLRKARPDDAATGGAPSNPQLAEQLGLPSAYDARFRIHASFVAAPERVGTAVRMVARRMAQRAAAAAGPGGGSGRWGSRDGRPGAGSRGADREGGGSSGSGVTPDIVETATRVVEEYRRLLPWFEDFHQRRQMARLRKLQADRAALPAAGYRGAIVSALEGSPAVVVAGDTGCGKSTQIPQFLAAAGYRRIAVTQPRRISAVSLARRVAVEACDAHGTSVAFKVRFSSSVAADSRIVFCTEGILLRELVGDPMLAGYDVVVLDEVHERHLTTDFLLALLRALLLQRPELRLVLMSATINCVAFADYFGGAPIVQIPGRLYPIQLVYVPPENEAEEARRRDAGRRGGRGGTRDAQRSGGRSGGRPAASDQIDPAPYQKLLQRIDSEIPSSQRGDLLIFVAGTADITALCKGLAPYAEQTRRWILMPLHAGLPLEQQEKVFDMPPEGVRKAVISTNIAETSLTIDGVRFVADSGRAKEMIHEVATGGGSLQEGWISRASADQRKGRAGRTGPGVCYRIYSEAQYNDLRAFSAPEIARVRLEAVVLGIKAMAGSGMDPRVFGFLDPPPPDRLEASITNLKQIGALNHLEALTPLGAVLSLLPVDVAIGKVLVLGCMFGLAGPALTLAAALSVQSPFLKLGDEDQDKEAKAARAALVSPHGDPLTLLNVFETWLAIKEGGGEGGGGGGGASGGAPGSRRGGEGGHRGGSGPGNSARWCRRHGLAESRLYEMAKLRAQFAELLADAGILRAGGGTALSAGALASRRRHHRRHGFRTGGGGSSREGPARGALRGAELHAAKRRLRDLQAERERQRGRKVLKVTGGTSAGDRGGGGRRRGDADRDGSPSRSGGSSDGSSSDTSSSGEEELERLHDLDLRVHVDVRAMAAESSRPISPADVGLLRHLLAACLYPRVAVADEANHQRREQDCRFHTAQVSDLVVHPGSSLYGTSNSLPRGQVLLYQELIETRRQYLSCVTPLWSLPALLLAARRLDLDTSACRWLVDGWLLLRLHDGTGGKVLQLLMELRGGAEHLISSRLRRAKLAALSAVQTFEDDADADGSAGGGGGGDIDAAAGAPSRTFQRGYAALAAALPEELRPLLSGVLQQQAAWREAEAVRRRREAERQERQWRRRQQQQDQGVRGGGDWSDSDGEGEEGGTTGAAAAAAPDAELEDYLAERLALDTWPVRYSLERLPPGNKVTAQYILEPHREPQAPPHPPSGPQAAQQHQQQQHQGQQPPHQGPESVGAAAAAAGPAGGPSGAAAVGVATDPLGVPHRCAGVWLAPWLRYGSLRSYESAMALHALQPALRKAWLCPGCGVRLVATFAEVRAHVEGCEAVAGVDPQAVETLGYAQAVSAPAAGGAASGDGGGRRGKAGGGGGGGASRSGEEVDDGPLAASGRGSCGAEGQRNGSSGGGGGQGGGSGDAAQGSLAIGDGTSGAGAGGGRGGGGGIPDIDVASGAVARLVSYMDTAAKWCRRRPAARGSDRPSDLYGMRGVPNGARQPWGGGGASAVGTAGIAAPAEHGNRQHGMPPSCGGGGKAGADAASAPGLAGPTGTAANLAGAEAASAGVGPGSGFGAGALPTRTARPYKCSVCGLDELMTPPQILQHKRQHGQE